MTNQPDNPNNPNRRKPPPPPIHPLKGLAAYNKRIESMTNLMRDKVGEDLRKFMLYAFLAEVEMMPSQVILVQSKNAEGQDTYHYEPKANRDPIWKKQHEQLRRDHDILRQKASNLASQNAELREELEYLRGKR